MARPYKIISGDSHLDLSPERWKHHVPAKWRDQAPKVVRLETGEDAIVMGDRRPARLGFTTRVNVPREEIHLQVPTFETAGGTGSPEKRLREQDQDGVEAEILFSASIQRTLRVLKDDEGYLALVHAYNEYLIEEYCAAARDRLIAMGVMPGTGVGDAVKELEYCAKAGFKGVMIDKFPSAKGYPTPEDDKFWAAALDHQMAVTHHTNGGTSRMTRPDEPTFHYTKGVGESEDDGFGRDPMKHWLFRFCGDAACAPIQMAWEGVWDRFPKLQIYWAETMIGWLPYALWQIDNHYERYKYLASGIYGLEFLERLPSEYVKAHCLWGFLEDPVGVGTRHAAGVDKLIWGSDFAHAASNWPNSHQVIEENFAGVPEDERHLMLAGNAVRFFHLDK